MRSLKWLLVLAALALWVAAARPQERFVPEGTTIELILVRQKSVQQELKLSPEAIKKVMEFTNKQHDAFLEAIKGDKEGRKEKILKLDKEDKQFLTENLTTAQRKRLAEITLQVTGLHELNRPEAAKLLNLTEE